MDPEELLAFLRANRSRNVTAPLDTTATAGQDNRLLEAFVASPFVQDTLVRMFNVGTHSITQGLPAINFRTSASEGNSPGFVAHNDPTTINLRPGQIRNPTLDFLRDLGAHEVGHTIQLQPTHQVFGEVLNNDMELDAAVGSILMESIARSGIPANNLLGNNVDRLAPFFEQVVSQRDPSSPRNRNTLESFASQLNLRDLLMRTVSTLFDIDRFGDPRIAPEK